MVNTEITGFLIQWFKTIVGPTVKFFAHIQICNHMFVLGDGKFICSWEVSVFVVGQIMLVL